MILEPQFLARLDRLRFAVRHIRAGQAAGERRSTKRGTSVEFADYRDYTPGDDLRRVDWNIYARLERPYVKLFEEEEDLAVHVILDGSGSMDWGAEGGQISNPKLQTLNSKSQIPNSQVSNAEVGGRGENKWGYGRRLAAALGYVALVSGDRLTISVLQRPPSQSTNLPPYQFGPARGRGQVLRLFDWLAGLEAGGTTDLNAGLGRYAVAGGRAGLVLLISDLFSPAGYIEGLTRLAARGHEIVVIHVLTPDEIEPPLGGDLRLLDVETGQEQEVTIDGGMRALYRRRLEEWRAEIRATCRARDAHYVPVETDTPCERVVLYELRRAGVVR